MAKKVVATLQDKKIKKNARVIFSIRSPKTEAYSFKEQMMMVEDVENFIEKNCKR